MQSFGKLRDIQPEELQLMLVWRNAPSVRNNMYTRHEISIDEHLAWWARIKERTDHRYFMYELNGAPLGVVAFTGIDPTNQSSSWAFYASPDAPKGTGSKMEFLALEYAFNALGLHKLHGEVLAFNTRVIKLHQKFGFRVEGILREQNWIDDQFVDVYRIGLLAHEWMEHRALLQEELSKISKA